MDPISGSSTARSVHHRTDGYFYVADTNNYRVQVIAPNGKYVRGWGEKGAGDA
ncbi:MAG: hypothetical protein R2849_19040 [Thermomicrobiales bacterium]